METETLDKLFLELAQVTKAKTAQQIKLETRCAAYGKLLKDIFNHPETALHESLMERLATEIMK